MIGSFEQHVALLKQLTKLNDLQKLLIELYDKPDKTPAETKNLAALVVSEKAAIRANNAKQKAQNLINTEKSKAKVLARKKRTRKLIELGALFEIAELANRNPAQLLGALLAVASITDSAELEKYQKNGLLLMNQRKAASEKVEVLPIENQCPKCGSVMSRRPSKQHEGKFWWACTNYPTCTQAAHDKDGKPHHQ
jgi:hypothetical protein